MSVETKEEEQEEDFTILPNILNDNSLLKKKRDLYHLPEWMSSLAKRFDNKEIEKETTVSINEIDYLDKDLQSILINDLSIQYLFPVQSQVIPHLIEQNHLHSPIPPSDICVSSPTGSGKTLTYVIPLLQCIRQRVTHAIRIVILLPVQDLAEQVYHVVNQIGNKLQLKTALLAGQHSFEDEQKILVKQQLNGSRIVLCLTRHVFKFFRFFEGWISSIDIVVCTPGRLVEHISRTPGFCLTHLRYLVIDEADRIIDEFKQDWLNILDNAVGLSSQMKNDFQPYMLSQSSSNRKTYQKLLFSATLTHNPEILQQLNLFRPVLFSSLSSSSIAMPSTLRENFIVCSITYKPLIVAYLIQNQLHSEKIMIFVHSKKDVDRLSSLLRLLLSNHIQISQISRNLTSNKIQTRLNMFEQVQIQIIVCSDILA
jgi:ATP-dependent RNA helicase DDX51/DBP6